MLEAEISALDSVSTASAMYSFGELNSISAAFAAYGTKQTRFGTKLRLSPSSSHN
ncbi:hypothetical protein L195_g005632 [Trifolium pratense]|uniref:Uncharacterized protein n=1 Tax=Trifolium pratense TaxID=57577 RepID=A0A2K3P1D3_TRIPR|nr:hypothetical protein L195_g005632 [Trifolium pratense]